MTLKRLLIFTPVFVILACQQPAPKESSPSSAGDTKTSDAGFAGQMQSMAQDIKNLLPYLYDREAFSDPKNHETIDRDLKQFAQAAHHVQPDAGKRMIGDDLLVEYSLSSLTDDLGRAVHSFESGQTEYARSVAKASLGYCFQCHSVTQPGKSAVLDIDQLAIPNIAPLEKADLFVAARKYDKALAYMENLLSSPEYLKTHAFDFESLLRRYLALIIRVENAPHRALTELNKILKQSETPHYIVEQAEGWKKSLKDWEREVSISPRNAKTLFKHIEKRFKKAESLQHYEKDHAGDVEYLRATEQLHAGLKLLKTPADQARALYFLGRAYEVLDELGSWNLHETYYEACVDKDPKAPVATRCYNRLEASLLMGYSGSSGTHLPNEERDRLKRLKDKLSN